jgi:D-alanine-D-alanine ligase
MRVGVTYDLRSEYLAMGYSPEETAEFDSEITINAICSALATMGLAPVRIGGVRNLVEFLARGERCDMVFNFCEGLKGNARESQVPALLEAYDIPYVFSDALTLALSLDKGMAKRIVRDAGVPTTDFRIIEKLADVKKIDLPFPLFLKPVQEGSGKGVDANSKVENARDLRKTAAILLAKFNEPVLVETFLPGREFTVGIIGTAEDAVVLGVSEIVPVAKWVGDGYGFENKEEDWKEKVSIVKADQEYALAAGEVALAAWRALRCRDGGRVDIRCDGSGKHNFIEVNPLAGLRPEHSDLCIIAEHGGLTYNQLIGKIMTSFFKRHPELKLKSRARAAA